MVISTMGDFTMSLLYETIIYMILSIVYVTIVDHLLYKYDVRDYKVLGEKQRFLFMMTMLSLLYLFYTIIYDNTILPIVILSICISFVWIWFFIMDIDLKLLRYYEKISILGITLIVFISLFFSIEYIFLLGLQKFVRIDLCDNSSCSDLDDLFGCNNDDDKDEIYIKTYKSIDEITRIVTQHIRAYDDQAIDYSGMIYQIVNDVGKEIKLSDVLTILSFDIHET